MQTYLEHHGTTIYDTIKRQILDVATRDGYNLTKNDQLTDGKFDESVFGSSWTFVSGGILYYFLTNFCGQIESFFELNTKVENCTHGSKGCYYDVTYT